MKYNTGTGNLNYARSKILSIFSVVLFMFLGVFALLQAYAFLKFLQEHITWSEIQQFFNLLVAGVAGLGLAVIVVLTYFGKFTIVWCKSTKFGV